MTPEKKTVFSDEQLVAIETRDRTLLVSAAAGSGKTTTLTERIIRSLTDEKDPDSLSNMLIVTFTNAAVYDLKDKIGKALRAAVDQNPENKRLETELYMLDYAKIQTIDSFCADLVRGNAERLGITPAYRICEKAEILILERTLVNDLAEAAFNGEIEDIEPEKFEALSDALTGVKNTSSLTDTLISLYEKTKSTVRGVDTFFDFANSYLHFSEMDPDDTVYGKYVLNMVKERLTHYCALLYHHAGVLCGLGAENAATLGEQLCEVARSVRRAADSEGLSEIKESVGAIAFPKAPSFKGEKPDEVIAAIKLRDEFKKSLSTINDTLLAYTPEEWQALYRGLSEHVSVLAKFLKRFSLIYFEEKRRRGAIEFSDTERLAYECLWQDGELTETALSYRERLSSVYIDEYQDVNELQNKIFEAVSPTRARFMVGDIKQSIYGFRSARPEIFRDMKKSFPPLRDDGAEAASIFMSNNYRCDEGIVDFVNAVFDKLFGIFRDSIGYVDADKLRYAKKHTGAEPPYQKASIYLLEKPLPADKDDEETDEEEESDLLARLSPDFVASKIKELIENGKRDDGSPIKASDIAIILRTRKKMPEYEAALREAGIKASAAEDRDFFLNKEVLLTLSLLYSIDNPAKDIHLAALMCSPLYSFTADELYIIRSRGSGRTLYDCAKSYSNDNPQFTKLSRFLDTLRRYRLLSEGMSIDSLLTLLYHESGLLALAAKQGGKENLEKLYNYAKRFEGGLYKGLYGFLSYVNNIIENNETINKTDSADSEEDAVFIGTIHSSKGLEFPVVFLSDASKELINLDEKEKIAFSEDFGISFLLRGPLGLALVDNPIHRAIRDRMNVKHFEELIRLLYVALTRAKERLYIIGECKNAQTYIEKTALASKTLSPYSVRSMKSYAELILSSGADAVICVQTSQAEEPGEASEDPSPREKATKELAYDADFAEELKRRFAFRYPNAHMTVMPEKMSVSRLYPTVLDGTNEEYTDLSDTPRETDTERRNPIPSFIDPSATDESALRGIATHNFMQFFDPKSLTENGVEAEMERLISLGFLSEKTASLVRLDEIRLFARSELVRAMLNAKKIYREFRFNTRLPAEFFTQNEELKKLYRQNTVLVQGVIDCLIENADGTLRLIDYKTDRLKKAELENEDLAREKLISKHSLQLSYYALAAERIFGKKPSVIEIYSTPLGKTIKL